MKLLITGGTGLIGQALINQLRNSDDELIILSRSAKTDIPLPPNTRLVQWDARTGTGWSDLIDKQTVIINLAGAGVAGDRLPPQRWTPERKTLIRNSRVWSGEAILDGIKKAKEKPFLVLQCSAIGYYGTHQDDRTLTESSPAGNDFLANVCLAWEASTASLSELNVRRVVFRTGVVFSPDGGPFPLMTLPFKFFAGGKIGSGKQWIPWIHIADQIGAMLYLINHPQSAGTYNLCSPNPITNAQFAQQVGQAMNRPALIPTPAIAMKLALGEMSIIMTEGQRVIPQKLIESGYQFAYPQLEDALSDLI